MSYAHTFKQLIAACCALSFLVAGNAISAELFKKGPSVFNYNFAEIKYLDGENGADGIGLTGSGDIQQNIAIRVDFARVSVGSFDSNSLRLGGTYYKQSEAFPQADMVFSGGFDRYEDESGLFLSAGTRYAVNDALELNGTIILSTAFDTDISLALAGLYEVSPGFSAFVETEVGDGSALALGVRFYWR